MKFVDELPPAPPRDTAVEIDELRARRGQWAEVARYGSERSRTSAWSRGRMVNKRHPDIEYAVRSDGDEYVLYLRATDPTTKETP